MAKQSSYAGAMTVSMPPKMPQNLLEARGTHRRPIHSESLNTPFVSHVVYDARALPLSMRMGHRAKSAYHMTSMHFRHVTPHRWMVSPLSPRYGEA